MCTVFYFVGRSSFAVAKGTGVLGPYTRKVLNTWLANASH